MRRAGVRFGLMMVAAGVWLGGCAAPDGPTTLAAEASRRRPNEAREYVQRGIHLLERGEYEPAERAFQRAVRADAFSGVAHNNLGLTLYQRDRLYAAAWQFQHAAKLLPYQSEPRNNLGMVLEAAGKLDEAVEHYDRALKMQPNNPRLIGNLLRARIRRGDRGPEIRRMLGELVLRENRPPWLAWARRQLALRGGVQRDSAETTTGPDPARRGAMPPSP